MFIRQNVQTLRFFRTTPAMRCPYLPHRLETKLVTELSGPDAISQHDTLTDAGFRRSHHFVYKPLCDGCRACVPVRIRVRDFEPSRMQRRLLRRNEHVDDRFLVEGGRVNYWGYNTLGYFAPDARYSSAGSRGEQVREFKAMVKTLHAAGIEVAHPDAHRHAGPAAVAQGLVDEMVRPPEARIGQRVVLGDRVGTAQLGDELGLQPVRQVGAPHRRRGAEEPEALGVLADEHDDGTSVARWPAKESVR